MPARVRPVERGIVAGLRWWRNPLTHHSPEVVVDEPCQVVWHGLWITGEGRDD